MSSGSGLLTSIQSFEEVDAFQREYFSEFAHQHEYISVFYLIAANTHSFVDEIYSVDEDSDKFGIRTHEVESREESSLHLVEFTHDKAKQTVKGNLLAILKEESNLVKIMTDEGKDVVKSAMQITDKMYPAFERYYISSNLILEIIDNFLESGYDGRCQQYSCQRWWEEGHKPQSFVDYPNEIPLEEIRKELNKPSISLRTYQGYFSLDGEKLLSFALNHEGEVRYRDGRYNLFEEILQSIESEALEEIEAFEDIDKEEKAPYLEIEFEGITREKEQDVIIKQFRNAVQDERTFAEAVIHGGNPYYHSSVSDRDNGSSFEIVFSRKEDDFSLNILPDYKLTKLSVLKFKKAIFSKFGEGVIRRKQMPGD